MIFADAVCLEIDASTRLRFLPPRLTTFLLAMSCPLLACATSRLRVRGSLRKFILSGRGHASEDAKGRLWSPILLPCSLLLRLWRGRHRGQSGRYCGRGGLHPREPRREQRGHVVEVC